MSQLHLRIAIPLLCLLLAACGFQLRRDVAWPAAWQPLALVATDPVSPLRQELELRLRQQGVVLVAADAAATLEILRETVTRQVLSVDERARVSEYVLILEAEYRFGAGGQALLPPTVIRLSRDYSFDELQALGAAQEEELIQAELRRDLARRIMEQVGRAAATPTQ